MASSRTTFGATVLGQQTITESATHLQEPSVDSPCLTPCESAENLTVVDETKAFPIQSPFYEHPPASYEVVNSHRHSQTHLATAFDRDAESGRATLLVPHDENPFASRHSLSLNNKECTMWPSKQTLIQNRKLEKKLVRDGKGCGCLRGFHNKWSNLTKRQRLYAKLALGLLLIGIAVAIGVGINIAVHGSVYSSNGESKPITG